MANEIIGRREELLALMDFMDAVPTGGSALLFEGDAGIGKTSLWQEGVCLAEERGFRVLTARSAQSELQVAFATMGDLFAPALAESLPQLLPVQRTGLEVAFLIREPDGPPPDTRLLATALVSVVRACARDGPLLIALDDAQWVDASSAGILRFMLRRLEDIPVGVLATTRGRPAEAPLGIDRAFAGFRRLPVEPLSLGAIHRLLRDRLALDLPRPSLVRVHETAGGNPFFALELARANPSGGDLVLPDSLHRLVADRVSALPVATRRGVAELALAGTAGPKADLGPAVEAGVLVSRVGAWRFSHPLLAEAAVSLLDPGERRAIHREIAEWTVEPERRALHLALAADGPDETVAVELARAAERAERRGAPAAAAERWELAAGMTGPALGTLAAERFVHAGVAHVFAGNFVHGVSLLDANVDRLPPGPLRQRALLHIAGRGARTGRAEHLALLERALAEAVDPSVRLEVAQFLAASRGAWGDAQGAAELAQAHLRAAELADDELLVDALWFSAYWENACDRSPWALIERARSLPPAVKRGGWPVQFEPREVLASALLRDGRIEEAHALLEEWLADYDGSIFAQYGLLKRLAIVELAAGRLQAAAAHADRLLGEAESAASVPMICDGLFHGATAALLLGETETARAQATRMLELVEETWHRGDVDYGSRSLATLGLLELSLGNGAEAAAFYRRIPTGGWQRWFYLAGGRAAMDAIEAFSATGELDRARELAALLPADARERPVAEACLAAAGGRLEEAIELIRSLGPSSSPFRQARELLLLGRLQRQAQQKRAARETLERAAEIFERLGARTWSERTRSELRRIGGRTSSGGRLSETEQQIVDLVVAGRRNREVAAALSLSPNTIAWNLSKIYRKLGVNSRTELAAHMTTRPRG